MIAKLFLIAGIVTCIAVSCSSDRFIEGDIRVDDSYRSGVPNVQWNFGMIPYGIDTAFTLNQIEWIRAAILEIQDNTCIRFVDKSYADMVYFKRGFDATCWSYLGKQGGKQEVHLSDGCFYSSTVMHEIIHAIGFAHEQARFDRDNYVIINFRNIKEGEKHNFNKQETYNTYGLSYDYFSIMHYTQYAFGKYHKAITIQVVEKCPYSWEWCAWNNYPAGIQNTMGTWAHMSDLDAAKINLMYKEQCNTRTARYFRN